MTDLRDDPTLKVCASDCPCRRRGAAMRIDTLRNKLTATRALLDRVQAQLEDLHVLAYDRPTAVGARVHGGDRDWALDTHGDQVARQWYRHLAHQLTGSTEDLVEVLHSITSFLAVGPSPTERRDRSADVTADELRAALDAQARRRDRGDYTPASTIAQPGSRRADSTLADLGALQGAVRKIVEARRLDDDPVVPDRSRLTPAELGAWNRAAYGDDALPSGRRRRKKARRR